MGQPVYVSLDLETSGSDMSIGAVPIQLGIALGAGLQYSSMIGWPFDRVSHTGAKGETLYADGTAWSEEAGKIHDIPIEGVRRAYHEGRTPAVVAQEAADWLSSSGNIGPREGVAVGWNVGSFDFLFVRKHLEALAGLFSYRFMDLNSVCFTLAQSGRRRAYRPDHALGFDAWKKRSKKAAEAMIGGEPRWHDAGYDALASLLAWYWLCDRLEPREGAL